MQPRYHTVFFDAGGTLLRPHPSIGVVYTEVAARFGIHADHAEVERSARRLMKELRDEVRARGGRLTSPEAAKNWWREVVRGSFGPAADTPRFEEFYQAVFDEFALPSRYHVFPDVAPVFSNLRKRGYRIGIISNWDTRLRQVLDGLGLSSGVDPIIISGEVGVEKPDPKIFELARERSGSAVGQPLLHIGDDPVEDFESAQKAGFDARLLDRAAGQTLQTILADLLDG